jgi:hypothetical protein
MGFAHVQHFAANQTNTLLARHFSISFAQHANDIFKLNNWMDADN